ncbi:MAG: hypothetical protein ABW328_00135 [Ilumatobacteraceae bacterium]
MGQAICTTRASRVADEMFIEAARALAVHVTSAHLDVGPVVSAAGVDPGDVTGRRRSRRRVHRRTGPGPHRPAGRPRGPHHRPLVPAGVRVPRRSLVAPGALSRRPSPVLQA